MTEKSKYPIGDMGDDFQPDAMEDFEDRVKSGEFKNLTMDQIRSVYVNEEIEHVQDEENAEHMQRIIDDEENGQ